MRIIRSKFAMYSIVGQGYHVVDDFGNMVKADLSKVASHFRYTQFSNEV